MRTFRSWYCDRQLQLPRSSDVELTQLLEPDLEDISGAPLVLCLMCWAWRAVVDSIDLRCGQPKIQSDWNGRVPNTYMQAVSSSDPTTAG
ncbi:hypothetical protein PROFUN_06145 [Planoprotostelium fungivorum]|uniref:Uncharacterized protein n=1 Tax=Planoprotostelium fungivorum TaxID=1890364 RepID=A0A2P6NPJ2_9EUKA|nr:hypothetical protein PROFUN_06145 [Planoprotostelium fungivorum]